MNKDLEQLREAVKDGDWNEEAKMYVVMVLERLTTAVKVSKLLRKADDEFFEDTYAMKALAAAYNSLVEDLVNIGMDVFGGEEEDDREAEAEEEEEDSEAEADEDEEDEEAEDEEAEDDDDYCGDCDDCEFSDDCKYSGEREADEDPIGNIHRNMMNSFAAMIPIEGIKYVSDRMTGNNDGAVWVATFEGKNGKQYNVLLTCGDCNTKTNKIILDDANDIDYMYKHLAAGLYGVMFTRVDDLGFQFVKFDDIKKWYMKELDFAYNTDSPLVLNEVNKWLKIEGTK